MRIFDWNKSQILNPKSNWRKRQDLNLHELSLDGLANRYGYRFITFPLKLERVIGFEPMIYGFADRRLCLLGDTRIWI